MPSPDDTPPRLLADIGATYARFCIERERGQFERIAVLPCADYGDFISVMRAYLNSVPNVTPRHGAMAIAYPIDGDAVRMTNRDWAFSIQEVQQQLGLHTLLVVNNYTALAMSLPGVGTDGRVQVGGGEPAPDGVIGLIGPGTGLGVSALIPTNDRWVTLATEGGHASFAPNDERELRVLRHLWKTMPHVSAERLVSGPGIELIHEALRDGSVSSPAGLSTAEIVQRAQQGSDAVCVDTIDCFCAMLGTVASNLALTLGATGGIYVGGGMLPRLGELFYRSPFRRRFEAKGRFAAYLARIPTYVLTAENLAFHGVSTLLAEHAPEHAPERDSGNPLLERIGSARETLSPAERRVANVVLENPRTALNDPIAAIARLAGVSQPTVIRFCTAVGFDGFQAFKLRLAQSLALGRSATHSVINATDSLSGVSDKIFEYTLSSLDWARRHLDRDALRQAVEILAAARSIEFFGYGASGIVARDAEQKFPLFGVPCRAQADFHQQIMAASMMKRGDVALVISNTGRTRQIVEVAEIARSNDAKVIGLVGAKGPVSARCDVTLLVETLDNTNVYTPTTSRIAALVMIDILSTAVALSRDDSHSRRLQEMKRQLNAARSIPDPEDTSPATDAKPRTRRG